MGSVVILNTLGWFILLALLFPTVSPPLRKRSRKLETGRRAANRRSEVLALTLLRGMMRRDPVIHRENHTPFSSPSSVKRACTV